MDGEGVGAHEGRGQQALGEFAARGRLRVTLSRRHGHQVQQQARRRLSREVEGTATSRDRHAPARQVAASFGDHRRTAHDDDLLRKIDAVVQVVGPQGTRDERTHLRGRGTQVRHQASLGRIVRDTGLSPGGRSRLGDARAGLARQLTHGTGHVVDLAELRNLNAEEGCEPAVQVRFAAAISGHGHVGIREGNDPGTRVAARCQQRQRRRRAILQVINDHDIGHRTGRLHTAKRGILLPCIDQLGRERLDA